MCQLCAIKTITSKERWPKPLEQSIKDLTFLVETAHDENSRLEDIKQEDTTHNKPIPSTTTPSIKNIPAFHLQTVRDICTLIAVLDQDRGKWWTSAEKQRQRRIWAEKGEVAKIVGLQKVNNATSEMISAAGARVGGYVRWGIGMQGGVEELEEAV